MPIQKIHRFLFISITIVVVIIGVLLLVVPDSDLLVVRAEQEHAPVSPADKKNGLIMGQQLWLTDTFVLPGHRMVKGTQIATFDEARDGKINRSNAISATYISPAAFHQASNSRTTSSPADGFSFWPEGGYIYNTSNTTMTLIAPVRLPDGANMTKFSMVLFDNDAVNDVTAILYRKNLISDLATTPAEEIVVVGATLYDPQQVFLTFNTAFVGPATVSSDYGYYIAFQLAPNSGSEQRVFGFSVTYTPPALPTPESGFEVVSLAAFRHNGNNADDSRFDFNNGYVRNNSAHQICFMAPAYPPDGATLDQFKISIADAHPTSDLVVHLQRIAPANGLITKIAAITSTGTSIAPNNSELTSTPFTSVVDSSDHYYITYCFDPNTDGAIRFFGARLHYTGSSSTQNSQSQSVPAAAFMQASQTGDAPLVTADANKWLFETDSAGGFLTNDSVTDQVCLAAPVNLLTGRTIDSFTVYVEDNFKPATMTIFLDRTNFFGQWNELARISSVDGGGIMTLTDATISTFDEANVISSDYNYHISFCLPAGSDGHIKVYGAQVDYLPFKTSSRTLYLPIILATPLLPPMTTLMITNQTGGSLDYTVFQTPEGDITCTIPNGAVNQICGIFTPGTYNFKAIAHCGEKVGQRTYKPDEDTLTPFRCI